MTDQGFLSDTFSSQLCSTISDLLSNELFADVTLVSDDQIHIQAHKIVLTAFSPVLRSLLLKNPHPNPMLYMRGIKHSELQAILRFMYCGEVSVFQSKVEEFLDIAKDLQIKGISNEAFVGDNNINVHKKYDDKKALKNNFLVAFSNLESQDNELEDNPRADMDEEEDCLDTNTNALVKDGKDIYRKESMDDLLVNSSNLKSQDCQLEEYQKKDNNTFDCVDKIKNDHEKDVIHTESKNSINFANPKDSHVKKYPKDEMGETTVKRTLKQNQFFCQHCNMEFKSKRFLFSHITSCHGGLKFSCNECSYSTKRSDSLKLHVESTHEIVDYFCSQCDYSNIRQYKLRLHQKAEHEGVRFPCNQCDYVGKQRDYLREHIGQMHDKITYDCSKCDFKTLGRKKIRDHTRVEHQI